MYFISYAYLKHQIKYDGHLPCLTVAKQTPVCSLTLANVTTPLLFANIRKDIKPIATKSRRFSSENEKFINQEISTLLSEGIIELSSSPWRAQVVIANDELKRHKKRLCIDYSSTMNIYTELDAYPLPKIETMVNNLAKYKFYSTFDLRSAYHQIPIHY